MNHSHSGQIKKSCKKAVHHLNAPLQSHRYNVQTKVCGHHTQHYTLYVRTEHVILETMFTAPTASTPLGSSSPADVGPAAGICSHSHSRILVRSNTDVGDKTWLSQPSSSSQRCEWFEVRALWIFFDSKLGKAFLHGAALCNVEARKRQKQTAYSKLEENNWDITVYSSIQFQWKEIWMLEHWN